MYVCGPTVYGRAHIGNARPAVVFDTLARLIRHEFGEDSLVYARNVTDVDDKIIAAAEAEGVDPSVITERYERFYLEDMGALGVAPPDIAPHATQEIAPMVAMIERLIERGNAYEAEGHVLFSVPSDPDYGVLSRRDREQMIAGARVEVAPYKRDPADFVLWKPSPEGVIGWDSPWGRGRPGWHIECSAMIARASRRDDRHPRRRARPHLPAPRERDRAEPLRPRRRAARALLGAQRLRRHGRGEDVEEPRQYRHAGRAAGAGASRRDAAAGVAVGALSPAAAVDRGADRASRRRSSIGFTGAAGDAEPGRRSTPSVRRSAVATISTRRSRCSRADRRSTIRRCLEGQRAACSGCSRASR